MLNHPKAKCLQRRKKKSAIQEDFWTNSFLRWIYKEHGDWGRGREKWLYFTLQVDDL